MGLLLFVPLAIGLYDTYQSSGETGLLHPENLGCLAGGVAALILGGLLSYTLRSQRRLVGVREGMATVTIGWVSLTFFSCLPLVFWFWQGPLANQYTLWGAFTDGYFEIMSGFTTTGATILTNVEAVPRSLLFLRSLTHWLGGMGIITLAIVVFPGMGVTAYQMFQGEVPGPSKDKLKPRLSQTTSILWGTYGLLTGIEAVLLFAAGMTPFEAVCHSFATMATGGFSTANSSIAAWHSDWIRWIIILFMYFAGINFLLHFRALRGDVRSMFRDSEFKFYNGVIIVSVVVVSIVLYVQGLAPVEVAADQFRNAPLSSAEFAEHYSEQAGLFTSLYATVRTAAFQTVAIVTTTGFATADFDMWPDLLRFLLVFLMFFGGCAGSTGGGMKMIRVMIVFKAAFNVIRKRSQPRLVLPVKMGGRVVEDGQVVAVMSFFIIFTGLFVIVAGLMTLFVDDLTTAVACSIATIANIGPGLAGIGAIEHYGWIPTGGKWLLVGSMLLGRLEIFTVLICLRPSIWRK
jgi:trk system potassium uptake protein TrkH